MGVAPRLLQTQKGGPQGAALTEAFSGDGEAEQPRAAATEMSSRRHTGTAIYFNKFYPETSVATVRLVALLGLALVGVPATAAAPPAKAVADLPLKLGYYAEPGGRCDVDPSPKYFGFLDKTSFFDIDTGLNFVGVTQTAPGSYKIRYWTADENGKRSYSWETWKVTSPTAFTRTAMGDEGKGPDKDFKPVNYRWCAAKSPPWS